MEKDVNSAFDQKHVLIYQRPVRSRDNRLWLCFVKEEDKWALSTNPFFPKSIDLGFRWEKRMEGIIMLNLVSNHKFGSDDMFSAISKYNALFKRTAKKIQDRSHLSPANNMGGRSLTQIRIARNVVPQMMHTEAHER